MGYNRVNLADVDIIGELANAHEGEPELAVKMINSIATSVDAVKIQVFTADDLAVEGHENYELYQKLTLSTNDIREMAEAAHENDVHIFADILGEEGLNRIPEGSVDGFKIHSSDIGNRPLIGKVAEYGKPTIISAGGATPVEIRDIISSFEDISDAPLGLMYGYQNYPTKLADAHLHRLRNLVEEFGDEYPVGYTSHVDGGTDTATRLPGWAVASGADFLEIHTTLDRSSEGLDYYSSLEPDAFETMAERVEEIQTALGENTLQMSESELEYRREHKKCVVTREELHAGDTITEDGVALKRPEGTPQRAFNNLDEVLGKTVKQTIERQNPIRTTDVEYTVAATLACRAESTRLYGKPLQLVGEKSILAHQIAQLREVDAIDEIVLAVSDTPSKTAFEEFAADFDLEYVVGDEVNVLGRVIAAGKSVDADIAVRVTTENPFIYHEGIDEQIETTIRKDADLTVPRNLPLGSFAEVISMRALERAHKLGDDRHRSELVTSFITENPESFDIVGMTPPEALNRPDVRLTVDNPCDLILVRNIWEQVSNHSDPYNLESVLDYYDSKDFDSINEEKPDGTDDAVADLSWHIYGDQSGKQEIIE
ncbi:N-acetylneuraminate synthase family protein [Haloarcula sp. GH36]|uniref:N-acetylneuraminate synthase family protein n=1 Tax=Haloarcula montana TaxID=3111776 RepID=UPI002D78E6D8|nr:N-acetylneuraminate synthase family protein [Haloarcula sp. GH36]